MSAQPPFRGQPLQTLIQKQVGDLRVCDFTAFRNAARIDSLRGLSELRFKWRVADNEVELAIEARRGFVAGFARLEKVGLPKVVVAERIETQLTPDDVGLERITDGKCQAERCQIHGVSTQFDAEDLVPNDGLERAHVGFTPVMFCPPCRHQPAEMRRQGTLRSRRPGRECAPCPSACRKAWQHPVTGLPGTEEYKRRCCPEQIAGTNG